jgi:hypothetical protein
VARGELASAVTRELERSLEQTAELVGGDVEGTLGVLSMLIPLQLQQLKAQGVFQRAAARAAEATNFTRSLGAAANRLIDPSAKEAWMDLPDVQRKASISSLFTLLESSAAQLTHFIGRRNTRKFDFSNMALRVEVRVLPSSFQCETNQPNTDAPHNVPTHAPPAGLGEANLQCRGSAHSLVSLSYVAPYIGSCALQ